uniref:Si:dkey-282h22.5 n=1 Tax=Myripristis murdjan TaxID=586833 RepID=A0A668AUN9_9TELE
MRTRGVLALICMLHLCGAQKWKEETSRWDTKEHSHAKTCSNLTQVLDNWKFAIMTQVKDMLVNDYASVLPEYSRIQPLSDALGDLYKQFNSLKDELGKLTSKFDRVEAFVDDLQDGRLALPQRPIQRFPPRVGLRSPLQAQMRAPEREIIRGPALIRARGRRVTRRP